MRMILFPMVFTALLLPACQSSRDNVAAKHRARVLKAYEYINAKDWDGFTKLLSEAHVDHYPRPETTGRAAVKAGMESWARAFPDMKIQVRRVVCDETYCMAWVDWSGTFRGELMGIKPTGKAFKVSDVDVLKFDAQGLSSDHWAIQDFSVVLQQVGAPSAALAVKPALDFIDALNACDLAKMKSVTTPDFKILHPDFEQSLSLDQWYDQRLKPMKETVDNFNFKVAETVAEGGEVVFRARLTGRQRASGTAIDVPYLVYCTTNGKGRLSAIELAFNQKLFDRQRGTSNLAARS